jgi:transposase-like protein
MADKTVRYAPEFKRQMVDLVRSGRSPASLAKEFGPSAKTTTCPPKRGNSNSIGSSL